MVVASSELLLFLSDLSVFFPLLDSLAVLLFSVMSDFAAEVLLSSASLSSVVAVDDVLLRLDELEGDEVRLPVSAGLVEGLEELRDVVADGLAVALALADGRALAEGDAVALGVMLAAGVALAEAEDEGETLGLIAVA